MKNAITVIDQELIDHFDSMLESDAAEFNVDRDYIHDLLQMTKDLIEINAKLTKREQKYKMAINDQIRYNTGNDNTKGSYMYLEQALKGDSDD